MMRIAVQLQPQHAADYGLIRDAVLRSEDAGVDAVFNWDHFFPLHGDPEGAHFECWTMLGAWAEQTERVQIGALVTGGGYRNPDLLADMARTVDNISGGRLILGMGAGWFEKDYDEYGYEFGTAGSRIDLLGTSLERIEARLAALNPPPVGPLPLLIGGSGERKTLRHVATYADIWHSFADVEQYRHKSAVLAEHCAAVGRDPSAVKRSTDMPKNLTDADVLAEEGVGMFTIPVSGPNYDLKRVHAAVAWRDARG